MCALALTFNLDAYLTILLDDFRQINVLYLCKYLHIFVCFVQRFLWLFWCCLWICGDTAMKAKEAGMWSQWLLFMIGFYWLALFAFVKRLVEKNIYLFFTCRFIHRSKEDYSLMGEKKGLWRKVFLFSLDLTDSCILFILELCAFFSHTYISLCCKYVLVSRSNWC